jgi:phosphoribosylanthranilate isomerase
MNSLFENESGNLKIKVCGMRDEQNIADVISLSPDFMGLIFYPKSKRYVGNFPLSYLCKSYSPVKKVGVFVNESIESILEKYEAFHLDIVQLHGNESVEYCQTLKDKGIPIVKAFGISEPADLEKCEAYASVCDAFLFDTKSAGYGGAGVKFDWHILDSYKQEVPFLLSGGISEDDVETIAALHHPFLRGVDLNSCFELAPAFKDVDRLRRMIEKIRK